MISKALLSILFRQGTSNEDSQEVKRIYRHPLYKYPNLYNDVAVLELGRRIEYNFNKFGDSPVCMDQGQDNNDKLATVQGFGVTEDGDRVMDCVLPFTFFTF